MKAVYSHPDYLTYMHIQLICIVHHEKCKAQNGIKIAGRNISNLRYADDTTLVMERKEELNSLLMKVKEKNEKAGLKLNFIKQRSWHTVPSFHGK